MQHMVELHRLSQKKIVSCKPPSDRKSENNMKNLGLLLATIGFVGSMKLAIAGELPAVTVWKSPSCACCGNWVKHMENAGFKAKSENVANLDLVKNLAGIPENLRSCHTSTIGGYKVEGHVPASDIKRLMTLRPKVEGIAVPGMPSGSPGMENGQRDPYDVFSFARDGKTQVFSRHR